MRTPICDMVAFQMSMGRQWLGTMVTVVNSFTSVLDPRPDLSVPARRTGTAYRWWW